MILITGGAGMLGAPLVRELVGRGHKVRALTLPGDRAPDTLRGVPCEIVRGDVSDGRSLAGIFDGVKTVYHLAAVIIANADVIRRVNVEGTRNVAQGAASSGVGHFVYVSSAAVLYPYSTAYARSKMEGERIVTDQADMRMTIVRPTLIYGKGGGQEFTMFLEYLDRYPVIPFIGRGSAKKNPIHVEDLVRGLAAIAGNPKTYGKTYNLCGGQEISIRDMARLILLAQGRSKPIVSIPVWAASGLAAVLEKMMKNPPLTRYAISRIVQDAAPDGSETRKDLGLRPIGFEEGIRKVFSGMGATDSFDLPVQGDEPGR
jgi:nucleoside-diphosphate-sugar epimerase